jgi:hypothetical protein
MRDGILDCTRWMLIAPGDLDLLHGWFAILAIAAVENSDRVDADAGRRCLIHGVKLAIRRQHKRHGDDAFGVLIVTVVRLALDRSSLSDSMMSSPNLMNLHLQH